MPPPNENGPQGGNPETRSNDQMAEHDSIKVQPMTHKRHVLGQLPAVVSAALFPPAMGLVMALIVPDDICPGCGDWHNHKAKWPVGALVEKKARCGAKYQVALHAPRTTRRGRRAA